jgi:hypothetical protein
VIETTGKTRVKVQMMFFEHTSFLYVMSRIRMGIPIYPYARLLFLHLWKEQPFVSLVINDAGLNSGKQKEC